MVAIPLTHPGTASAHERRTVGKYQFVVGWLNEPAFSGQMNSIDLRVTDDLLQRAMALSAAHLDGRATPAAVRWVDNQQRRWGSCTPEDRSIRLSRRLATMPDYVVDYVLLHELAHLIEPGHGPAFRALMARYPKLDRAEGYLEGVESVSGTDTGTGTDTDTGTGTGTGTGTSAA